MRKKFEMTDDELESMLEACKPVPYMVVGGVPPRSQQENANSAWRELGDKLGFDSTTVRPVSGEPMKFFTAEPTDVEVDA